MKNKVKLIYFDVCVLSWPFDDQIRSFNSPLEEIRARIERVYEI